MECKCSTYGTGLVRSLLYLFHTKMLGLCACSSTQMLAKYKKHCAKGITRSTCCAIYLLRRRTLLAASTHTLIDITMAKRSSSKASRQKALKRRLLARESSREESPRERLLARGDSSRETPQKRLLARGVSSRETPRQRRLLARDSSPEETPRERLIARGDSS